MYKGSPKPRDLVPIVTLTANGFTPGKGFFISLSEDQL